MTTCRQCKYSRPSDLVQEGTHDELGHCWRYPPTGLAANQSAFPIIKIDSFNCGEFKKSTKKAEANDFLR